MTILELLAGIADAIAIYKTRREKGIIILHFTKEWDSGR